MENPNKPGKMPLDGNLSVNWSKFKKNLEINFKASTMGEVEIDVKAAILKNLIGEEALELIETTLDLDNDDLENYDTIVTALDVYCKPRSNVLYARDKFYHRKQMVGEPFENFYRDLKKLVTPCEFGTQEQTMLRDRIVFGVIDQELKELFIKQEDPSLESVMKKAKATEDTKVITREVMSHVNELKLEKGNNTADTKKRKPMVYNSNKNIQGQPTGNKNVGYRSNVNRDKEIGCSRCRTWHKVRECPAFGKKCRRCGVQGHFEVACNKKNINQVSTVDSRGNVDEILYVSSVEKDRKNCWLETVLIKNKAIEFKIDTGSEVNVLPIRIARDLDLNPKHFRETNVRLEAYGGKGIKVLGKIELECENRQGNCVNEFFVVEENACAIIGLSSAKLMGYISIKEVSSIVKDNFVRKYCDVFEGMGKFPGKYKIVIDPNAIPVVRPARRIPIHLRDRVNKRLNEMLESDVIARVEEPTNWVNNCTFVEKSDGSIRVCLDPNELNKQIVNENYSIPSLEELTSKLNGCKYFSVLDLKSGFWQVELDDESSKLCTFNTIFGCFRFKRLPFGLKTAPMVFQRLMKKSFNDIDGVQEYIDDLLIASPNREQHDQILEKVILRARELKIKFNEKKFQYCVPQVKYFGHIISSQGIQPDCDKIKAIKEITAPQDKKALQGILGMINYLRAYIPNMSELTSSLSALLKKNVEFKWLEVHTGVLEKIKNLIASQPVLGHFDAEKPVKIQTDASQNGLGSCLLQNGQPIAYASRGLTETEKRYAQIEKELLAIVYACRKFHHYIYGRQITVETDHQPLISIFKKDISNIFCARIQIMRMKLLKYNVQLVYVPGKYMFMADLLSRNFNSNESENNEELFATDVVHSINVAPDKMLTFVKETSNDAVLSELVKNCVEGWPNSKTKVGGNLKRYWNLKNEIYYENGILFLNDRIIVPRALQNEMLSLLHEGHFGISKTMARARTLLYWLGMNSDIENMIGKCAVCEKFRSSNRKETLIPHEIPTRPFEKIAVDVAQFGGNYYLVLFDYFSKWLEVRIMGGASAYDIIKVMESIFSIHGIPEIVMSDNMPFSSWEFKKFANENNFQIITSSPRYARSNGMAEKGVHIAKQMLKKCAESGKELWKALLEYRDTPIFGLNLSPAQMLMSRRLRTKLPIRTNLLEPKTETDIKSTLIKKQNKMSSYYNKRAHSRVAFEVGEDVVYQEGGRNREWSSGKIVGKADTPRSYLLMNKRGNVIRRNSFHLRKSKNKVVVKYEPTEQDIESGDFAEVNRSTSLDEGRHGSFEDGVSDPAVRVTRTGREIKTPKRFQDFIMN